MHERASKHPVSASSDGISPEEAYEIAYDAYVFAFPLNYYYRTIHEQLLEPTNPSSIGDFGRWRHDNIATPTDTDTTVPNNDTPYSWAWVDLRTEPWVLTQPPAADNRFYTSVWGDLWGFINDYPGSVLDGQDGGRYLLTTKEWDGDLPPGVRRAIIGETSIVGTLTRTAVADADDVANMQIIQNGYRLEPLSSYLGQPAPASAPTPAWPLWDESAMIDPRFFELTTFLLQFVISNPVDNPLTERMARLGIEAVGSYRADRLTPTIHAAIHHGIRDAHQTIIDGARNAVDSAPYYGPREFLGTRYLDRAVGVEAGGILPNVPRQAWYAQWTTDNTGASLDGLNQYRIQIPAEQMPSVNYFWSLTMYDLNTRFLVDNPINRYSIGDRTPGLR